MKFSTLDKSLHKAIRRTYKFLQGSSFQGSRQLSGIFHAQIGSYSFLCHAEAILLSMNKDWGSTCDPRKARDLLRCTWLCPTLARMRRAELCQRALQELVVKHQDREIVQYGGSLLSFQSGLLYPAFYHALVAEQNLKRRGFLLHPLTRSSHTTTESHKVSLHWER